MRSKCFLLKFSNLAPLSFYDLSQVVILSVHQCFTAIATLDSLVQSQCCLFRTRSVHCFVVTMLVLVLFVGNALLLLG